MFGFFKKKQEPKQEPKGPTEWVYMGDGMMIEDTRSLKEKAEASHRENLSKIANIKTSGRSNTPFNSSTFKTRPDERRSTSSGTSDISIYAMAASYGSDSGYSDSSSSCSSSASSCD